MRESLQSKVDKSIERLKAFCPPEGYYLAFSGGKDSCVCKALLDMSRCKYTAYYRLTGIDPPELVQFIKEKHPDVQFEIPRYADGTVATMWKSIIRHGTPPTRIIRYCCQELKESGGDGRMMVTGVRWEESSNRASNQGQVTIMDKKAAKNNTFSEDFNVTKRGGVILINDSDESRRMIESCYKRHKTSVNPIIDWTTQDVWDFIKGNDIPYCSLYDEGFQRIGCIGCPMAQRRGREKEFARYPKYRNAYIMAFDKMLKVREARGNQSKLSWANGEAVFHWWMEDGVLPNQINLFEDNEND